MGDIRKLIEQAVFKVENQDTSKPGTFWLKLDETRQALLQVPAQKNPKRMSFYVLPPNDPTTLPLQIPMDGFEDTVYIPLDTAVRLLVVDQEQRQVLSFDPPLLLSTKITSEDIATGEMIDLVLPERGIGADDKTKALVAAIRSRQWGDFAGLGDYFNATVARWDKFFTNVELQKDLPERTAWLKSYYGLLVGSSALTLEDERAFNPRGWTAARSQRVSLAADDAFDPTRQGMVVTTMLRTLTELDPRRGKKRNSAR
ncbi:MAG: hypothetical protein HY741_26270 [Chloroflexi bacterium]|nr:hypothetical protein [Chloroflexota bacterium]